MATNKAKLKKKKIRGFSFQLILFSEDRLISQSQTHQSPVEAEAPGFSPDGRNELDRSVEDQGENKNQTDIFALRQ